ncbi:MAG: hypothetical protein M0P10_06890 [Sphaerochaetaceae bacterium]|nr:hypothetical protein [Sphaerochaetaceae bacterium]
MARKPFTMENNIDKVIEKIQEKPQKVLNIIGRNLVKEIKPTIKKRTGRLRKAKSLSYWARKREKDLQIGFKLFYATFVYGRENDPIKPICVKNASTIQRLVKEAIEEINKE